MITFRNLGKTGRLGNQLFQIASTIGIARQFGDQPVMFPADWIYRPYFNLPDTMFGPIPDYAVDAHFIEDAVSHIDPRARPYLQDYNLFADDLDEIREYFFPSDLALNIIALTPDAFNTLDWVRTLGVHVRRGDNVVDPGVPNKSDYHLCPDLDYYSRGMMQFLVLEWDKLAVFSDDIPWCRENFKADFFGDGRAYWKEHEERYGKDVPNDWIDLFTLARCKYFVVSGSTFGIWGALIAGVPDSHVVRPSKVYGPALDFIDESLMFPPDWKVIHAS